MKKMMIHISPNLCPGRLAAGRRSDAAFTLVEVSVALVVCVLFGAAAFTTNQSLLSQLKAQKETTAANMMLQERMESFRGKAWSDIALSAFVLDNVLTYQSPPLPALPAGGQYSTFSEVPLGGLTETVTVSGYTTTAGGVGYPDDGSIANQWVRDTAGSGIPVRISRNSAMATGYNVLRVHLRISWKGSNGRVRIREMAETFGKGNIGP
jgi:type II secretory pathway pseudopilin PulG